MILSIESGDDGVTALDCGETIMIYGNEDVIRKFAIDILMELHEQEAAVNAILPNLSL